jgi:AICAR transformylase/IMP cyclohydrolase PurH
VAEIPVGAWGEVAMQGVLRLRRSIRCGSICFAQDDSVVGVGSWGRVRVSVAEVADAGEDHGQAQAVGGVDDFVVADRSSRLNDGG